VRSGLVGGSISQMSSKRRASAAIGEPYRRHAVALDMLAIAAACFACIFAIFWGLEKI